MGNKQNELVQTISLPEEAKFRGLLEFSTCLNIPNEAYMRISKNWIELWISDIA